MLHKLWDVRPGPLINSRGVVAMSAHVRGSWEPHGCKTAHTGKRDKLEKWLTICEIENGEPGPIPRLRLFGSDTPVYDGYLMSTNRDL